MTARKSKADEATEKDAEQAAEKRETEANRGEKDVETTEQQADREVPGSAEEADDARSEEFETLVEAEGGTEIDNALGTVSERDSAGHEYDVPWRYLDANDVEEALEVRTSDSDDPARSWTNQATLDDDETPVALVPVQQQPGQTFRASELPDPEVMKAAGINVAQFLSGVPVRADVENEAPRKGIPA